MTKLLSFFEHPKIPRVLLGMGIIAFGLMLYAVPAIAGIGGSVVPDYPSPVTAGQTGLSATLTITNGSTAGNAGNNVSVTSITHTPSCGSSSNNTCTGSDIDTGVFTVHNGTGRAGTACAGISFTAGAPDSSGKVTFTPGSAVTLGPASGSLSGAQCIIDFTVDVLKVPSVDSSLASGVQTTQLGSANFQDQSTLGNGTASGSSETTVAKASPSISTTPNPTSGTVGDMLNDTATLSGGVTPTGSVTFKLYPPADSTCAGTASYTDGDASSPYATSPGFLSNTAGTWHWTADYAGDSNNNATSSGCTAEPVTVAAAKGHIIVDKVTVPSGSSQSFSFTTTGTGYNGFSLTDAGSPNNQEVDAGSYTVAETAVNGWTSDGGVCDMGETPDSINVGAGETVTCTFTNTQQKGHLVVQKTTLPDATSTSFAINATGSGTITGGGSGSITDATDQIYEVTAGTYSVSETVPTNWSQTSNTCSNVSVSAGATSTCVITNTYNPPNLQYCSPGYWKQDQHFDSWVGYSPTDKFGTVFEPTSIMWSDKGKPTSLADPTLLQALQANGGGINMLVRAAVDALLNSTGMNSGMTATQVINAYNAVHPGSDSAYQATAASFTKPENCPLN